MADIKFACPNCQQHIQAEPGYAGMQIACPTCKASMVVPGVAAPPPPVPALAAVPAAPAVRAAAPGLPAAPAVAAAPQAAAASGCPSCGGALPRGAVICTRCGYNLATRQRTVAGRPAALGKPGAPQYETPWYKTPYPYLGVLIVVLAVLYFLGRDNPSMKIACAGTAVLYYFAVRIVVLIAAFQEGVGTGFLTLCLPIYDIYFVWKVNENQTLKILYSVAVVLLLVLSSIR